MKEKYLKITIIALAFITVCIVLTDIYKLKKAEKDYAFKLANELVLASKLYYANSSLSDIVKLGKIDLNNLTLSTKIKGNITIDNDGNFKGSIKYKNYKLYICNDKVSKKNISKSCLLGEISENNPTFQFMNKVDITNNKIVTYYNESKAESKIKEYTCYIGESEDVKEFSTTDEPVCIYNTLSPTTTYYHKICATSNANKTTCSILYKTETYEYKLGDYVTNISDICLLTKEGCKDKIKSGITVDIKVNEKDTYTFYVINEDSKKITLILDHNLIDKQTFYNKTNDNRFGPVTILEALISSTKSWTNLENVNFSYDGVGRDITGNKLDYGYESVNIEDSIISLKPKKNYGKKIVMKDITKARLLTIEEATNLGCSKELESCPEFLYKNLSGLNTNTQPFGYWLLSVSGANPLEAYNISYSGDISSNNVNYGTINGVRPVITISKK